MMKLFGEIAYELFMSSDPFPLHEFLEEWKEDKTDNYSVGYVLAVIGAYNTMCSQSKDGRYEGVIRRNYF
jgi:hypothetical protein